MLALRLQTATEADAMALFFGSQIPGNDTTWEAMKSVAEVMDGGRWTSA